jgi:high-affinity K+ transport system ATPase subunit B
VVAREAQSKVLVAERVIAKSDRPVEKYGDVDHQLKKA